MSAKCICYDQGALILYERQWVQTEVFNGRDDLLTEMTFSEMQLDKIVLHIRGGSGGYYTYFEDYVFSPVTCRFFPAEAMLEEYVLASFENTTESQVTDHSDDSSILGVTVVTANAFVALQEGDESCPTDGLFDVTLDMVSSICVKETVPPIVNHLAVEGKGAKHPSYANMQSATASCDVLHDGNAIDSLKGTSADAPTLLTGDEACFLNGPSVDTSDMQASVNAR
ncbi:hypothetical protein Nepgr_018056 [Nepenthes gracilis]|uniref:Uncharacterized protein n=1 Tax=Nepenthes gracilis TaxID=150966 RepID=A0AAD3XTZ1_NEPGR|nr:hypothetical protein Nepgr_018056 [Nepenthes gracilis]